jgi:hypothetical protein
MTMRPRLSLLQLNRMRTAIADAAVHYCGLFIKIHSSMTIKVGFTSATISAANGGSLRETR